jgi:hypothetical protein
MKSIKTILVFSMILFSCEKQETNQRVVVNSDIPLISKIMIDGERYMEYSYNSSNLVIEEKSKYHYTKHNYNTLNQLQSSDFYWDMSMASSSSSVVQSAMNRTEWVSPANTPLDITHDLYYNEAGQLFRRSLIRTDSKIPEYSEFVYEGDKIISQNFYYNGKASGHLDYFYDEKGNLVKQMQYITSDNVTQLVSTTEYEFDNMNNPFIAFSRLMTPGINTNPNNILKETYTLNFDVDQFTEKVQVKTNYYEYNNLGFPVKVNGITEYSYN